ncbi:MAG: hypothetical protein IKR89_05960, partial [Bacteroidaceae bacterium]|nr:hypothetical protein [Bacteroidaceae bacterium]
CIDELRQKEVPQDNPLRTDINTRISGKDKEQAHSVLGQVVENTTILLIDMGKTKGFLSAIQHREILMTDLGLI